MGVWYPSRKAGPGAATFWLHVNAMHSPEAKSMNNPFKVQVPAEVAAAASFKPKDSREAERQHNREIEQRVKTAGIHRPMITRSVPHARGR
jgi:histidinol-phosphate/aromatic aminotransferase/cobyric acid decarboxylase-like protein